jgi:hypothetical protein
LKSTQENEMNRLWMVAVIVAYTTICILLHSGVAWARCKDPGYVPLTPGDVEVLHPVASLECCCYGNEIFGPYSYTYGVYGVCCGGSLPPFMQSCGDDVTVYWWYALPEVIEGYKNARDESYRLKYHVYFSMRAETFCSCTDFMYQEQFFTCPTVYGGSLIYAFDCEDC